MFPLIMSKGGAFILPNSLLLRIALSKLPLHCISLVVPPSPLLSSCFSLPAFPPFFPSFLSLLSSSLPSFSSFNKNTCPNKLHLPRTILVYKYWYIKGSGGCNYPPSPCLPPLSFSPHLLASTQASADSQGPSSFIPRKEGHFFSPHYPPFRLSRVPLSAMQATAVLQLFES